MLKHASPHRLPCPTLPRSGYSERGVDCDTLVIPVAYARAQKEAGYQVGTWSGVSTASVRRGLSFTSRNTPPDAVSLRSVRSEDSPGRLARRSNQPLSSSVTDLTALSERQNGQGRSQEEDTKNLRCSESQKGTRRHSENSVRVLKYSENEGSTPKDLHNGGLNSLNDDSCTWKRLPSFGGTLRYSKKNIATRKTKDEKCSSEDGGGTLKYLSNDVSDGDASKYLQKSQEDAVRYLQKAQDSTEALKYLQQKSGHEIATYLQQKDDSNTLKYLQNQKEDTEKYIQNQEMERNYEPNQGDSDKNSESKSQNEPKNLQNKNLQSSDLESLKNLLRLPGVRGQARLVSGAGLLLSPDSLSLNSADSCFSSAQSGRNSSRSWTSNTSSTSSNTNGSSGSQSSTSEPASTTIRVFAKCLRSDIEYKTVSVSSRASCREVVATLLSKYRMRHRDPNLFYLTMEVTVRRCSGSPVRSLLVLEEGARPAQLALCRPPGDSRFALQMRRGGVVKVHDTVLMPGSQYKSLLVSDRTTAEEVVQLLLNCYNRRDNRHYYAIHEVRRSPEFSDRMIPANETLLNVKALWPRDRESEFVFVLRRNMTQALSLRKLSIRTGEVQGQFAEYNTSSKPCQDLPHPASFQSAHNTLPHPASTHHTQHRVTFQLPNQSAQSTTTYTTQSQPYKNYPDQNHTDMNHNSVPNYHSQNRCPPNHPNHPVSNYPASNHPISTNPVSNCPPNYPTQNYPNYLTPNHPATSYPSSNYPASTNPALNNPVSSYPASNNPVSSYPASNNPVSNYPASNNPVSSYPASNNPVSSYPASNNPAASHLLPQSVPLYPSEPQTVPSPVPYVTKYPSPPYPGPQHPGPRFPATSHPTSHGIPVNPCPNPPQNRPPPPQNLPPNSTTQSYNSTPQNSVSYNAPTNNTPFNAPLNSAPPYNASPNSALPYNAPNAPPNSALPYNAPPNSALPYNAPLNSTPPYNSPYTGSSCHSVQPNLTSSYHTPPNSAPPYVSPPYPAVSSHSVTSTTVPFNNIHPVQSDQSAIPPPRPPPPVMMDEAVIDCTEVMPKMTALNWNSPPANCPSVPEPGVVKKPPVPPPKRSRPHCAPEVKGSSQSYHPTTADSKDTCGILKYNPTVSASSGTQKYNPTVIASSGTQNFNPTVIASSGTQKYNPTVSASSGTQEYNPTVIASSGTQKYNPTVIASSGTQKYNPSSSSVTTSSTGTSCSLSTKTKRSVALSCLPPASSTASTQTCLTTMSDAKPSSASSEIKTSIIKSSVITAEVHNSVDAEVHSPSYISKLQSPSASDASGSTSKVQSPSASNGFGSTNIFFPQNSGSSDVFPSSLATSQNSSELQNPPSSHCPDTAEVFPSKTPASDPLNSPNPSSSSDSSPGSLAAPNTKDSATNTETKTWSNTSTQTVVSKQLAKQMQEKQRLEANTPSQDSEITSTSTQEKKKVLQEEDTGNKDERSLHLHKKTQTTDKKSQNTCTSSYLDIRAGVLKELKAGIKKGTVGTQLAGVKTSVESHTSVLDTTILPKYTTATPMHSTPQHTAEQPSPAYNTLPKYTTTTPMHSTPTCNTLPKSSTTTAQQQTEEQHTPACNSLSHGSRTHTCKHNSQHCFYI